MGGEDSPYLLGVKKVVVIPLRVLSFKRSTGGVGGGAFSISFRELSSTENMTGDDVLF